MQKELSELRKQTKMTSLPTTNKSNLAYNPSGFIRQRLSGKNNHNSPSPHPLLPLTSNTSYDLSEITDSKTYGVRARIVTLHQMLF